MKKLLYTIVLIINCQLSIVESQWVQQTVPVTKPITGIKFINANTGWACTSIGSGGLNYCYILGTTNGGTNWIVQDSTFDANNYALSVVDANVAYVGGFNTSATANLHKTTNGGANWVLIPTPTNMHILDMQFLNKDSGWTVGGFIGPDVRTTTNGGLNWIVRTNGMLSQTRRIFFLNYNTGFCSSDALYKTTNAGLNWSSIYNPVNSVYSIYFMNESTGWLGLNNNQIHFTSNSGINWINQAVPLVNSQPIQDIYFINSQTGWGGRGSSNIYVTTNGGTNWGYQIVSTGTSRISFIDAQTGWGAIFGISKTTNNGGTIFYSGFESSGTTVPNSFKLYQNYPNPFNPTTTIKINIPKSSDINFVVFDILGKTLHNENHNLLPGSYEFIWDAKEYSSGIYFYRLTAINGKEIYSETRKMMLIK